MRTWKMLLAMLSVALVLWLVAPSSDGALLAFSGHIDATKNQHLATYTRFVGAYTYQIQLEDGTYDFAFSGNSLLTFKLKGARGLVVTELSPQENAEVRLTAGYYDLVVVNQWPSGSGSFVVDWSKK